MRLQAANVAVLGGLFHLFDDGSHLLLGRVLVAAGAEGRECQADQGSMNDSMEWHARPAMYVSCIYQLGSWLE
ncbi:hypothetical protein GCM10011488_43670 [Steroidobacter agaridevorans]|nr:hypothetical protein GCM10011488_43670 [Steroidobacter agaridevorans]